MPSVAVALSLTGMATAAAPTFVGLTRCFSMVPWTNSFLLTNNIFWLHFSIFTFDCSPYYVEQQQPENAGNRDGNVGPPVGAEGKVKCPETACECHSWCNTSSDTPRATLQTQFEWWLLTHPPNPQCLVQIPGAGEKAASPVGDLLWWKHWVTSWRSCRRRWADCAPWRIDMRSTGPLSEPEPTSCGRRGRQKLHLNKWRMQNARKGKARCLQVWWQEERPFPSLQLCFYRVDLMPW